MEDIEKRARELLALAFMKRGDHLQGAFALSGEMDGSPAINAIIAALTPPEGYVLVPMEPTQEMIDAFNRNDALPYNPASQKQFKGRHCYSDMISARPKVAK